MSEFKVGDKVWFFFTTHGAKAWGEDETLVYPLDLEITFGKIVHWKDEAHIYVDGCDVVVGIGTTFFSERVYRTKQEAIDAMIAHIKTL